MLNLRNGVAAGLLVATLSAQAASPFSIKEITLGMSKQDLMQRFPFECQRGSFLFGANEICKVPTWLKAPGTLIATVRAGRVRSVSIDIQDSSDDTFQLAVSIATEKYGVPDSQSDSRVYWYRSNGLFGVSRGADGTIITLVPPATTLTDEF